MEPLAQRFRSALHAALPLDAGKSGWTTRLIDGKVHVNPSVSVFSIYTLVRLGTEGRGSEQEWAPSPSMPSVCANNPIMYRPRHIPVKTSGSSDK